MSCAQLQGRTDPMGNRAMPWGPTPKGAHQASLLNQQWVTHTVAKLTTLAITICNMLFTVIARGWAKYIVNPPQ